VSFKDPDEPNRTQRQKVRGAINRFEQALYGKDFTDPETGYASFIDVESFIDWYLVEELFLNQDSYFATSVHVTWSPGGDIAMGPLWDFDLSAGTKWNATSSPEGYYTRYHGEHWINRMFDDPAFTRAVKARWAQLRPVVDAMIAEIPAAADVIRPSVLSNWAIWPQTTESELKGSVHADSFDGEVAFLRSWLSARAVWMSRDEAMFGVASSRIRERAGVIEVPVRILAEQFRPVQVVYTVAPGSATRGEDFRVIGNTLSFGPGENAKLLKLRILDDGKAEGPETVVLQLDGAASGVPLSDPSTVTFTIMRNDQ
jgi:CotH kinase protein/Calx-beta domain